MKTSLYYTLNFKSKACLVYLLILTATLACKTRQASRTQSEEKSVSELFLEKIKVDLAALPEKDSEEVSVKIESEVVGLMKLPKVEIAKRLLDLTKKIFIEVDLNQNWMSLPEEQRRSHSILMMNFVLLRIAIEKQSKSDPSFKSIVPDVYNATFGHRRIAITENGETKFVSNPNYGKIPLERFDDSRLSIIEMENAQMRGVISGIVVMSIIYVFLAAKLPGQHGWNDAAQSVFISGASMVGGFIAGATVTLTQVLRSRNQSTQP